MSGTGTSRSHNHASVQATPTERRVADLERRMTRLERLVLRFVITTSQEKMTVNENGVERELTEEEKGVLITSLTEAIHEIQEDLSFAY